MNKATRLPLKATSIIFKAITIYFQHFTQISAPEQQVLTSS
jgi:hypothetical protein